MRLFLTSCVSNHGAYDSDSLAHDFCAVRRLLHTRSFLVLSSVVEHRFHHWTQLHSVQTVRWGYSALCLRCTGNDFFLKRPQTGKLWSHFVLTHVPGVPSCLLDQMGIKMSPSLAGTKSDPSSDPDGVVRKGALHVVGPTDKVQYHVISVSILCEL